MAKFTLEQKDGIIYRWCCNKCLAQINSSNKEEPRRCPFCEATQKQQGKN